jgi:hypothetical protein
MESYVSDTKLYEITVYMKTGNKIVLDAVTKFELSNRRFDLTQHPKAKTRFATLNLEEVEAVTYTTQEWFE